MNIEEAIIFSCLSPIILTGTVLSAEREFADAISDVKVECSNVTGYAFERETSEVRNEEAHSNEGSLFLFMKYKQVPSGDENVASGAKGRVNDAGLLTSKKVDEARRPSRIILIDHIPELFSDQGENTPSPDDGGRKAVQARNERSITPFLTVERGEPGDSNFVRPSRSRTFLSVEVLVKGKMSGRSLARRIQLSLTPPCTVAEKGQEGIFGL